LEEELISFCSNKKNVGLLLTGGMDSRITAGVLKNLIGKNKINSNITAITWGIEESRDVIYSKEIAKRFNWEWEYISLSSKDLLDNIDVAVETGCEVSPIHIHAIPKVRDLKNLDCIIASSYGDSIGRGVYSSRHISNLPDISRYIKNWFFLFSSEFFKKNKDKAISDLLKYRQIYHRENEIQYREIEQQAHYMRRMLNPFIGLINSKIPTYQTFSIPEVYGYMWSLSSERRTDKVYSYIINKYVSELANIPWAKTGLDYNAKSGNPDRFSKENHCYHKWVNVDLFDHLISLLEENDLDYLCMFNKKSLMNAFHMNRKMGIDKRTRIDDIFLWIVSVLKMVKKYNLTHSVNILQNNYNDMFNSYLTKPNIFLFENALKIRKSIK